MMTTMLRLALAALVVLAGACGDPTGETRAGGTVDQGGLWGRVFLSSAVSEDGRERPLVEGTRIRLSFGRDHRLGAHAGCNSMGGEAEAAGGRLVVSDLATTEMGCDPARHDQDEWLAGVLTSRPAYRLEGAVLTLRQGSTELRLEDREVADPDRPLRGTRWVVDGLVEGDAVSSVPSGAEAHLVIDEGRDGFGGSTGCNQMGGTARPGPDTVAFSDVITTKMACQDDHMRLEQAVLAVLDGEVAWEIEADVLRLTHPGGRGLHLRAAS
jgi:heat shock protein HslJ